MITSELRLEILRTFKAQIKTYEKREPEDYEINKFLNENEHHIQSLDSQIKLAINKIVLQYLQKETKNENNGY